ncbi:RCC1-like domain-containing protein [Streptomyces goshikiensis]
MRTSWASSHSATTAGGWTHTLAVLDDQTVVAWGDNSYAY